MTKFEVTWRVPRVCFGSLLATLVFLFLLVSGTAWGQGKEVAKKAPPIPAEREAAAIQFIEQHQPELVRLLNHLRKSDPRQYQRAVRELMRTVERLNQTKQRDPQRYELELQLWKTRSRIDLLAAQWQMHPSDELRERLRAAVAQQLSQQRRLLTIERERLAQRQEKIDAQLQTLGTQPDAEIDRRVRNLTEGRRKKPAVPNKRKEGP